VTGGGVPDPPGVAYLGGDAQIWSFILRGAFIEKCVAMGNYFSLVRVTCLQVTLIEKKDYFACHALFAKQSSNRDDWKS
jgi:hypothetical protein